MSDNVTNIEKQVSDAQGQFATSATSVTEKDTEILFDVDLLNLYFGEDFKINDKIIIHQPTVGDFVKYGEQNVYGAIVPFVSNPTSFRVQLWDVGIDWNKMSDFELFSVLIKSLDKTYTKIIFGDIDFSLFMPYHSSQSTETDDFLLYNESQDIAIDNETYFKMSKYIQYMFNIVPKVEHIKGKNAKQDTINEDRMRLKKTQNEKSKSNLFPMISFCLNHPGFKYRKEDLYGMGIVEFMDSVQRLQIYENSNALLKGMYGGFIDGSKINKEDINFMRSI